MKKLYKYQQELVDKAEESTAMFWDMGLGKTITSLEIYRKFNLQGLFVICPVSMVDEWVSEFESQIGGKAIKYKDIKNQNIEQYLYDNKIECVVLNYDMVWRIQDYSWLNENFMIICDESHRIKNPQSKIGKYMKFLKVKTRYKICLTGTPQSKGYIDFYNQLFFLDKMNISFKDFKNKYCIYEKTAFRGVKINQLVGYKNVGELEDIYLSKCEFLKVERVYGDVVKHNFVKIPTTREYEKAKRDKVIFYNDDTYKLLDNVGAYRFGLRSLLDNKHKHQWLLDFLEDTDGQRVVIFYNYNHELESIKKICKRPFSVYNGDEKNFSNFKKYENGVAICNYKSGSFGINDLVLSNIFVAYSPTDNYLEWEQSKKRIDRDGQVNTPIYYYLESGMEKSIYNTLKSGKNFDNRVFLMTFTNIVE